MAGVRHFRVDAEVLDRLLHGGRGNLTSARKVCERGDRDVSGIDFEEAAKLGAGFAATETVGTKGFDAGWCVRAQ